MRFLPAARIVVLDSDSQQRTSICHSLAELGLNHVLHAETPEEVQQLSRERPIDLCVVYGNGFAVKAKESGNKVLPNPLAQDKTPAILVMPDTPRSVGKQVGYATVLGKSATPRLVYRYIGSVLQKARRSERLRNDSRMQTQIAGPMVAESLSKETSQVSED